jgi:hypothetical protein
MAQLSRLALCTLLTASAAHAQVMSDGDMNALPVGTAPDCSAAAGAWQFPPDYVTNLLCELLPEHYSIVATSSFDPTRTGNSLRLNIVDNTTSMHITNLFNSVIMEAPGQVVTVEWDMWVGQSGSGATAYIGADMGGGGFSNVSDRGPQLSWFSDGTIQYNAAGVNAIIANNYPRDAWQHVKIDIKLDTDTFDIFWGPAGGTQTQIGDELAFRSTPLDKLDRFSIAHFGLTPGIDVSNVYYDNITVTGGGPAPCYANCDGSTTPPILNVNDFICFQGKYAAGDPTANCDGSTTPPILNVNDFICFQGRYAAGCP